MDGLGNVQLPGPGDNLAQDAHPFRHDGGIRRSRQVGDPGGQLGGCHVLHRPGDRKLTVGCGEFLRAVTLAIPVVCGGASRLAERAGLFLSVVDVFAAVVRAIPNSFQFARCHAGSGAPTWPVGVISLARCGS